MQPSIQIRLGNRLRELRLERDLSQEALADLCQLDRTYISGLERGKKNATVGTLHAVAKALRVSLADLFNGIG